MCEQKRFRQNRISPLKMANSDKRLLNLSRKHIFLEPPKESFQSLGPDIHHFYDGAAIEILAISRPLCVPHTCVYRARGVFNLFGSPECKQRRVSCQQSRKSIPGRHSTRFGLTYALTWSHYTPELCASPEHTYTQIWIHFLAIDSRTMDWLSNRSSRPTHKASYCRCDQPHV